MDRLGNQCKEEKEIMINVSDQLLKESKENQDYYVTANVTLTDGTKLSLKKKTSIWTEMELLILRIVVVSQWEWLSKKQLHCPL